MLPLVVVAVPIGLWSALSLLATQVVCHGTPHMCNCCIQHGIQPRIMSLLKQGTSVRVRVQYVPYVLNTGAMEC